VQDRHEPDPDLMLAGLCLASVGPVLSLIALLTVLAATVSC
jgi:hypothetical protein